MTAVAALVLAAGASSRLGEPKQLVLLGGERLLDRTIRLCREAGLCPVIVVLGAQAEQIQALCSLADTVIVVNQRWSQGMGVSLATGASALPPGSGVVVLTCDQPAVTANHLRELAAQDEVTASAYSGRRGVPAFFPAGLVRLLLRLQGDMGAREMLASARAIELPGGELDIDTVKALAEARKLYG